MLSQCVIRDRHGHTVSAEPGRHTSCLQFVMCGCNSYLHIDVVVDDARLFVRRRLWMVESGV